VYASLHHTVHGMEMFEFLPAVGATPNTSQLLEMDGSSSNSHAGPVFKLYDSQISQISHPLRGLANAKSSIRRTMNHPIHHAGDLRAHN